MRKGIITVFIFCLIVFHGYGVNVSSLPYGINVHHVSSDVLAKVKDAGIKWIRTDAHWFAVETQKGVYDWTQVDRVVNYADANGLSILFMIGYTPGWANGNKGISYPADNTADWENFVRVTVNRYKSRVKYWNIWNEPNSFDFFALGKDVFVDQVFLPAARALRAEDPSAFIVGPELAHLTGANAEWYFWMKYILTNCDGYIDIVSHHIYKNDGVYYVYEMLEVGEGFIPSVKEVIGQSGYGEKPFWITETGWNTRVFFEDVQASRYLEMLQERREKSYPQKIFFYEIIDDPTPGIDPWGILRSNLSEKPAYTTYKDFIAGNYPDNGGGGDNGEETQPKKCFAEELSSDSNVRGRSQMLADSRSLRDELGNFSPAARKLTQCYYQASPELLDLSRQDSRIYRLGSDLIREAGRFAARNRDHLLKQKLDPVILEKAGYLLTLLKERELSPSFRTWVTWAERQLKLVKDKSLDEYLGLHLHREIQGISR